MIRLCLCNNGVNLNDACCTVADDDDVKRWEKAGREDILEYVAHIEVEGQRVCSDIWINPRIGDNVDPVPVVAEVAATE